jgi:hypothetical protein
MPQRSIENPSFVRVGEIIGSTLNTAFAQRADEVATLVSKGTKKSLDAAAKIVSGIYKDDGLVKATRARLGKALNRGADEVADSGLLKPQRARTNLVLDNLSDVVQRSADNFLGRIILPKMARLNGGQATPDELFDFVKNQMENSEHYWTNVANTAASRGTNYGSMLAAQEAGLTKVTYVAIIDEVTTEFCLHIDGVTIQLAKAIDLAEDVLMQSPEDMMGGDYWETAKNMKRVTATGILRNGLTLPPFHGNCRTTTWFH